MAALNKLVLALVACMLVAAPLTEAAISCGTVVSSLSPCITYLQNGGMPSPACCNGVKSLNSAASTSADRQQACTCLENAAKSVGRINQANAGSLPESAASPSPQAQPSTNCATVK